MDWFAFAQSDWEVYHDKARIAKFVEYGKITTDQYELITNEVYQMG
jgi:uncharacterized XkdX family phage protein